MIIELGMESQNFYIGLILLALFFFIAWFFVGRKGGYGQPTVLDLKKGENSPNGNSVRTPIVQAESSGEAGTLRDVTPQKVKLETPPHPPPQCFFVYNGHDWDAYEVLGVSPYSSFSEVTKVYQQQIKKADPGKHEFMQTAYMAILKKF